MSAASQGGTDNAIRVRVASYNVMFGNMGTAEQIGTMFQPYDLDIIGFCEVPGGSWTADVGRVLAMPHSFVGGSSSANHKDKYKSILSRTPLSDTREIEPQGVGWWPCTLVGAQTTAHGVPITVYSLHVPGSAHKTDEIAPDPTGSRAGYIAGTIVPAEPCPQLIMMGDYNDRLASGNLDLMEAAGMRSTWSDLDLDLSGCFTFSRRGLGLEHAGVIDHIFYRTAGGTRAVDGGIIELQPPLADHKPIWAELRIPTEANRT